MSAILEDEERWINSPGRAAHSVAHALSLLGSGS